MYKINTRISSMGFILSAKPGIHLDITFIKKLSKNEKLSIYKTNFI